MALKGNQKKLDKNNNNRIDAQDFKILKAEKAKDRGMGLQDEKVKPGKVMKAKRGDFMKRRMKLAGAKSLAGTTAKSAKGKTFAGYSKVFKTGVSAGDKAKATSTIIGVKPRLPKPSKESSLARRALRGVKATRLGKIVLPIAAAGVAAQQYLKSKMKKKKEEPKKKMGGGMMKVPGYSSGTTDPIKTFGPNEKRPPERRQKRVGQQARRSAGPKAGVGSLPKQKKDDSFKSIIITKGGMYSYTKPEIEEKKGRNYRQHKSYDASPRLISDAKGKTMSLRSMMGGGMMKPMGYKSGTPKGGVPNLPSFLKDEEGNPIPRKRKGPKRSTTSRGSIRQKQDFVGMRTGKMVKAKGCKLGRTRPTKIT